MNIDTNIFSMVIGTIASLLATIGVYLARKHIRGVNKEIRYYIERVKTDKEKQKAYDDILDRIKIYDDSTTAAVKTSDLIRGMEDQILARLSVLSGVTKEDISKEIDLKMSQLHGSIKALESRFPDEASLEKVSSINDAILSERIDQLSRQVANIEKKILSKWDVALIVGTIITSIFLIVSTTYGVLKALGKIP